MIKGILFVMAIALASLITAPAFMGTPIAATNQTSTDGGGGTDTTDGTTTDGATAPEATYKAVKAIFKGSDYKWECVPQSGNSFKVAVEPGTTIKVSRPSTSSSGNSLEETNNWGGYLQLEGVTQDGTLYQKQVVSSNKNPISGSAYDGKFSLSGIITTDNLCKAPHVGAAQAMNLTSTELEELSQVGKTMKITGPCNDGSGTVTVTAGGKSKTFGHTDIECTD